MKTTRYLKLVLSALTIIMLAGCSEPSTTDPVAVEAEITQDTYLGKEPASAADKPEAGIKPTDYSPYAGIDYPTTPLFGDTHLHTTLSFDAVPFGTFTTPEEAYRFARGDEIVSSTGVPAKIGRPLDFMVIADHAESMGIMNEVKAGNPAVMGDKTVQKWSDWLNKGGEDAMNVYRALVATTQPGAEPLPEVLINDEITLSIWQKSVDAADAFNDPGHFTALIGYEWSSTDGGNNLHRVVVYRDDGDLVRDTIPTSSQGDGNPETLWQALQNYEQKTGGQVLAIPHNGNLSNGLMFPLINPETSETITKDYAEIRSRYEPLYEITQIKGDGEAHPTLSPNDEFADFETWDKGNLDLSVDKTDEMLPYEYGRSGLKRGLEAKEKLGINPFKYGVIGSTDAHTGLAGIEEENFFGKLPHMEPSDHRMAIPMLKFGDMEYMGWEMVSSGYAAVWAHENTRQSIWDAMMRKETYATTGPRMTVRFFGGWNFDAKDISNHEIATVGYKKGVPMGGDLSDAPKGKSPTFLVGALKDAIGANLDRVQIVKGWLDKGGEAQERVYDIAVSDGRTITSEGRCETPVGNTVDIKNATWTNTIGESELVTVWSDPNFDPSLKAFYYVRVLEIPTPRWTAYDAKVYGITAPKEAPMTIQERAYSSSIWYTPND